MAKRSEILSVSAALAALVVPGALAPTSADANTVDPGSNSMTSPKPVARVTMPVGEDLMRFTVGDNDKGVVVADHESHASHASHSSHASHASGM